MVLLEGHAHDYDAWVASGCSDWRWADVAPWFGRVEVPGRVSSPGELGAVDRALLRAHPDTEVARLTRDASGRRVSVNDAYLEPCRRRPNLEIRGDSLVDRVLFEGRRAVGVRLADGTTRTVPAIAVPGVRDTTGAGDGFAAGFLIEWAASHDAVAATRHGHDVAAAAVRRASGL